MAIVIPVTDRLATNGAKVASSSRRFAKRGVVIRLAALALPLAFLLPFVTRGQTSLLLIATSASQPIQNKRADADDLSRMRDVAMIQRFRANNYHRATGLHVRSVGSEPPRPQYVRGREQARHQVFGRNATGRRHKRPVRLRYTQERRLRPQHEFTVHARGLVSILAMRTGAVRGREGANHELPRLYGFDRAADLFDNAAVLMSHRRRAVYGLHAAVRPKV